MTANLTPEDDCDRGHYMFYPGPHDADCGPLVPVTEEKRQADRLELAETKKRMLKAGAEYRKQQRGK